MDRIPIPNLFESYLKGGPIHMQIDTTSLILVSIPNESVFTETRYWSIVVRALQMGDRLKRLVVDISAVFRYTLWL